MRPDQMASVSVFPSHVCVCVFIYYKTALISLVQHSILCSLSISGNTDNKKKCTTIFPLHVFFSVGLQNC